MTCHQLWLQGGKKSTNDANFHEIKLSPFWWGESPREPCPRLLLANYENRSIFATNRPYWPPDERIIS